MKKPYRCEQDSDGGESYLEKGFVTNEQMCDPVFFAYVYVFHLPENLNLVPGPGLVPAGKGLTFPRLNELTADGPRSRLVSSLRLAGKN